MARKYFNICRVCGEVFEAKTSTTLYCSKPECQEERDGKNDKPTVPLPEEDKPLWFIAYVMHKANISWWEYTKNRGYYIGKYEADFD